MVFKKYNSRKNWRKSTKRSSRKGRRKNKGRRQGSSMKKRVATLERKIKEVKPEYKYTYCGPYNVSGQTQETMLSHPYFYSDSSGQILELPMGIGRGDAFNERIGHEVQLKRIMLQCCVRFPLTSLTPLWNSRSLTATSNSLVSTNAAALRTSIPCKMYVLRMEHADGSFANFSNYLAGFKKMFDIKEHQDAAAQEIKRQEVKVLATKSFNIKRRVDYVRSSTDLETVFSYIPSEFVINIPCNQKLLFNKADSADNNPQNYRYGVVLKFGTLNDNLITGSAYKVDKNYNPILQVKSNFWYTDS